MRHHEQRHSQALHDLKRKDHEIESIRQKARASFTDRRRRDSAVCVGMDCAMPLPTPDAAVLHALGGIDKVVGESAAARRRSASDGLSRGNVG